MRIRNDVKKKKDLLFNAKGVQPVLEFVNEASGPYVFRFPNDSGDTRTNQHIFNGYIGIIINGLDE